MNIYFSSLGGIGEIGMNMYLYETDNTAVIVDCGVKFASKAEPGIDVIIPDFTYLEEIRHKLKAVIITHAHEDHIGALPFLLKDFHIPVIACHYTHALIKNKIKEWHIKYEKIYFEKNIPIEIGDFSFNFIPLSHSIHGTGAIYIKTTDNFSLLHMSDYKIDFSPVSSDPFPIKDFLDIGKNRLDCLISDSTNCLVPGFTGGEKSVVNGLEEVFKNATGRIFFTSFSSNMERIQTFCNLAKKYNRKVVIEGSSFTKHITKASYYGKLNIDHSIIINRKELKKLNDNNVCLIATGSQGEKESVITRIVHNNYANIKVQDGDIFIFSSRAIPANEQDIINVMNRITKSGGKCITVNDYHIHVSGHPSEDDVAFLINLTQPRYLIPVHGEYIHLQKHKSIAIEKCNMVEDNIIISQVGERLSFVNGDLSSKDEIPFGKRFVDFRSNEILDKESLKYRKRMATEGVVFANIHININEKSVLPSSYIATVGFNDNRENEIIEYILKEVEKSTFTDESVDFWQEFLNSTIKRFYKKFTQRRPIIKVIIKEQV